MDDDLLGLAISWPLLQVLTLNKYVRTQTPTLCVLNFKGFCHLLQHCPHLSHFTIVIDRGDSGWVNIAHSIVCNHLMDYLYLSNSFLDDAKRVASILCAILPSLKEVDLFFWDKFLLSQPPESEILSVL